MTKARDTANLVATGVPNSLITLDDGRIASSNFVIAEFVKLNFVEFSCTACLRARVKTSCLTGVKSVATTCCVTFEAAILASAKVPVVIFAVSKLGI